ncbi:MAG: ABC transporter substrate-binding protein [Paracoccaceae bacterium]
MSARQEILRCLRRGLLAISAFALCVGLASAPARSEDAPLRIAVLKFGTVNWLMETITSRGLDRAEGVALEVVPLASSAATKIAYQSGDSDMLVADWVWVMRLRSEDKDARFAPYLNASGALVADAGFGGLCDLKDKTVGIVGGPQDKSWLVLQALADRDCGFDLAAETEALYGAPPLMSRQLTDGAVSAVSTYWHFVAKLEAAGKTPVIRISDAMAKLGIAPAPALIGFVWDQQRVDPAVAAAFLRSVDAAREVLATDDAAWQALRPRMRAKTDAEFAALRDAFRSGIPAGWTDADTKAAGKLYDLLATRAGKAFTSQAGPFDAVAFQTP